MNKANNDEFYVHQPNIIDDFQEHLAQPENSRIIFSGPFGTGKTRFIDTFFKIKNDKYIPIQLFPVHYSIASNQDIFELIKYDILIQLLEYEDLFSDAKFKKTFLLEFYMRDKTPQIFEQFLDMTGYLGKPALKFFKHLNNHVKEFEEYQSKHNKSDADRIKEYLENFEDRNGIHEQDLFTELIRFGITKLKETGKKIVLIIDDLDRIDPEHLFRILNILGAHIEFTNSRNKFDFDKVILICDLKNIHEIYHHKFGINTDFSGYISKFYSQSIYIYENKSLLEKEVDTFFGRLVVVKNKEPINFFNTINERDYRILKFIISSFILYGGLSMKDLSERIGKRLFFKNRIVINQDDFRYYSNEFESLQWLEIIMFIFGDKSKLLIAIERCMTKEKEGLLIDRDDRLNNKKVALFIPLIAINNNNGPAINQEREIFHDNVRITFKMYKTNGRVEEYYSEITDVRHKDHDIDATRRSIQNSIMFFSFFNRFVRLSESYGII